MKKITLKRFLTSNATGAVILLLMLGLTGMSPVFSQLPQPGDGSINQQSTLDDLIDAAVQRNPGLQAAKFQWQAALERVPQVKALPNPQLTVAQFIRSVETRVGPQRQKLGLMQMFPWFGKLKLKGNAALQAAEAKRQLYEQSKLNLVFRVKDAWYDYAFGFRRIHILKKNIHLLEYLEEVVRERYRNGMASYPSLLHIQVEKDKLDDRLAGANDSLRPLAARLNAALDRPVRAPLPVPLEKPDRKKGDRRKKRDEGGEKKGDRQDEVKKGDRRKKKEENLNGDVSFEILVKSVKQSNPSLKALDAAAAKEKTGIKIAKKNYYPDFSIGVDYILTSQSPMDNVTGSGKDPIAAKLSVSLPIWGKKNRAAVNEARLKHKAALKNKKEIENKLLARLEYIYYRYNDARRKVELYKNTLLPRAEQALEVTREAFQNGKTSFNQFIDSQRTVLAFQLELEEAKARRAQRLAELQMLSNKKIITTKGTKRAAPDPQNDMKNGE